MDDLIERAHALECIEGLVHALGSKDGGRCVLLHGEAGVGKTALLRRVAGAVAPTMRWLAGTCEPLVAAPPLGPLLDMLEALPPTLAAAVRSGHRTADVLTGMLELLRDARRPTALVVDDAQWADGATLDLLRYIGRRIDTTHGLLLIAFRDDELATDHPLRQVLGGLPNRSTLRLALTPLSRAGVAQWARRAGRSARGVYERTLGNPFFVGELFACDDGVLPASVRDAVLTRVARLSPGARELLELASVAPGHIDIGIVEALLEGSDAAFDECAAVGLLLREGGALGFRHDIARMAVAASMAPARLHAWHAALFDALTLRGAGPIRLIHHAAQADLDPAVLALAPHAAAEAAAASAHRQAVVLLELALARCGALDDAQHAALLVAHADECMLTAQVEKARASRRRALGLHQQLRDPLGQGADLQALARIEWFRGDAAAGQPLAQAAIDVLGAIDAPRERAMACATMAQLHLLGETNEPAIRWGLEALDTFERSGDAVGLTYTLNSVAAAELRCADNPRSWARLERALAIALDNGLEEHAARAYSNLTSARVLHLHFEGLDAFCAAAIAFCEARDLDMYRDRLRVRYAYGLLRLGRWPEAEALLRQVLAEPLVGQVEADQAMQLVAMLGLRRGDPAVRAWWDDALARGTTPGLEPWYLRRSQALTEAAWLRGDDAAAERFALAGLARARRSGELWCIGELACMLARLGRLPAGFDDDVPEPCARELAGDASGAARAWAAFGCPYAQALALLGAGEDEVREALGILDGLGAAEPARLARRRLRGLGAKTVQRGPNRRTRDDPLGLTVRERQMLELIGEGLGNREIAQRLSRSPRTVENHVAALLAKLGVDSRAEAAALLARPEQQRRNG